MKTAAAKGRRLFLLAAVCLLSVLLLVPAAEASRNLTNPLAPALASPAMPAYILQNEAAKAQPRFRLFADLTLPERPLGLVQAQKTASGGFTLGIQSNVWQTGGLGQNRSGPSFQGLWTDPVTGIAYARNRWYDARTASWLSEDPMGSVDSPNLYAFVAWGPQSGRDPMGMECLGVGDPDLSCSETLHIGEGRWAERRRELVGVVRDQELGAGERWMASFKANAQIPLYFAEELVRGVGNTPSRFIGHTEEGNKHVNAAFEANSTSERVEECSEAFGSYCFAFVEGAGAAEGVRSLFPKKTAAKALVPGEAIDDAVASGRGVALVDEAGQRFRSFSSFKRAHGAAGEGMQWHHIVEQTPGNVSRFGPETIHNTQNLMRLDTAVHRQVSGLYSSIRPEITGSTSQTVRQWLSTQSLEAQTAFGQRTLQNISSGVWP